MKDVTINFFFYLFGRNSSIYFSHLCMQNGIFQLGT